MSYQSDRITGIPAPLPKDYDRQTNFTDYQTANPGKPIRGTDLDAEFNAIEQATDETQARLRLIQRDDGALANQSVGLDQLTQEAQIGVNAPTDWAEFTQYNAGDSVIVDDGAWYICLESHVSSDDFQADLSAGKWRELINLTPYTTEAKNWATYPEDDPVPEGNGSQYSALHHATKALAAQVAANLSAQSASSDAAQTAADRAQTGQDATQTAADRVQTGLDRTAATNAATTATNKLTEFQGQYYGAYASDPTEDPNGNPPTEGDLYFSTTAPVGLRGYDAAAGVWRELGNNFQGTYDRRDYVVPAGGEDTFAVTYEGSLVEVIVNGDVLPRADYTATSGTDVVMGSVLPEGTEVTVIGLGKFDVADVTNALVTSASGTQTIGTALNDRVLHVPDIAALRALTGVQDGQRVSVTGYHPGSSIGGGDFYYDASRPKADHNGITVHSQTVPWDGAHASVENYRQGSGETDAGGEGCFVLRAGSIVNPYSAGAVSDEDSHMDLAAFFSLASESEGAYLYDMTCETQMSDVIYCNGSADKVITGQLRIDVVSNIPSTEPLITFDGWTRLKLGSIKIFAGSVSFSSKKIQHGVRFFSCGRAEYDHITVRGARGFGVLARTATNLIVLGPSQLLDCGTYTGELVPATYLGSTGGTTSSSQRAFFQVDLDLYGAGVMTQGIIIKSDERLHSLVSYDSVNKEATLHPRLPDDYDGTQLRVYCGGGVLAYSPDAGEVRTTQIEATRCGTGYWSAALYGGSIQGLVSQFCGFGYVTGLPPNGNGGLGEVLREPYFEANTECDLFSISSNAGAVVENPINLQSAKVLETRGYAYDPLQPSDKFLIEGYYPGTGISGFFDYRSGRVIGMGNAYSSELPSAVSLFGESGRRARTITLRRSPNDDYYNSTQRVHFLWEFEDDEVTFNTASGFTVNGGASQSFQDMPDGTMAVAVLQRGSTDWRLVLYSPQKGFGPTPVDGSTTYDPPSLADGESATTTVTVTGAALGDFATASFGADLQGVTLDAWVSAADTVSVKFTNNTGSAVDLASATLRARVEKA